MNAVRDAGRGIRRTRYAGTGCVDPLARAERWTGRLAPPTEALAQAMPSA